MLRYLALAILLCPLSQSAAQLPITVTVERDVVVQSNHNPTGAQERGVLYLSDESKEFRLKKGQQFQMVDAGTEGSCRIRIRENIFGITSCPWLDGFTDHQADIFRITKGAVVYTVPQKSK